jgi:hypothetical protein
LNGFFKRNKLYHFTIGIIQITKSPHMRGTSGDTSRLLPALDKVDAEGALMDISLGFIHKPHAVRAGDNTVFASDACFGIDGHDTVFSFIGCSHGTHADAGRIVTVLALDRCYPPAVVGKGPVLLFLETVKIFLRHKIILILAGDRASVAVHTSRGVYKHCPFTEFVFFDIRHEITPWLLSQ